jgi:hypothetical protein
MGLLDDAIREHLELKRRRGADPGEVAREQHEALEPVFPGQRPGADGDSDAGSHAGRQDSSVAAEAGAPAAEEPPVESPPEPVLHDAPAGSTVAQETAELDMQSVLEEEPEASQPPSPGQDSLEWEVPGGPGGRPYRTSEESHPEVAEPDERRQRPESHEHDDEMSDLPGDVPGQERMPFE